MGQKGDWYRDEDGQPLMDNDDLQDNVPSSMGPLCEFEDDLQEALKNGRTKEGSRTQIRGKNNAKPRRSLLKKGFGEEDELMAPGLLDEKRKNDNDTKQKKMKKENPIHGVKNSADIEEMWNPTVHNPEETEGNSPRRSPQGEEDEEINELFKRVKRKKNGEKNPVAIAMFVENVMAELEIAAEDDAELNREGKPAINKLKRLPFLTESLSKKHLQYEFLDHGVLNVLKSWLEPLPDGSLPNINIRAAVLEILNDTSTRRKELKKSGIGKVVMFLSKSDEETKANKRLARELVDRWSRPIFNKSLRFEDMREHNYVNGRMPFRRPSEKPHRLAGKASEVETEAVDVDVDLDLSGRYLSRLVALQSKGHARIPEATTMDYVIRPESKVDAEAAKARAKQLLQQNTIRTNISKKLQRLKAPRRQRLQAVKLSAEGRRMLSYM